jgi:nicotinate-nucleotide pyrophosphorylase (carboxylating)
VDQVRAACPESTPRVVSTRKTLPGYRDLALYGVWAGGGALHRVSLSGGVLIKENHIAAAGSMKAAVTGARALAPHGLRIEVEVRTMEELDMALDLGVDVVMLDNFTPQQLGAALDLISRKVSLGGEGTQERRARLKPLVEVSGGLNAQNISQYSRPGVDILSVGSITHSVKAMDLSLLVEGLEPVVIT